MMPSRWDWDWEFISMGIKTVKTVSLDWIMISFYPWLKPWAMDAFPMTHCEIKNS
jgi:hypothetical protein